MKYERLTAYSKINNNYITPYCDKFICDGYCRECDYEQVIINRLADFENKIENGTLVELPCKLQNNPRHWQIDEDADNERLHDN